MNFNPYLVFGVPMTADFATLRATYRRLARENHPDIAADKILATERMAQINRAWAILGDETKRADFNAQWREQSARRARQEALQRAVVQQEVVRRHASNSRQETQHPRVNASRNSPSRPGAKAKSNAKNDAKRGARNGAKLRIDWPSASAAAPSKIFSETAVNPESSPRALRLMRRITLASRLWHRDGDARGAIEMCRAVLLSDGRNVPARELLSEIFAAQGRLEIAVMMLDQAIQIAPEDLFLRRKRDGLESARFPGGQARPIQRPSLWQRVSARLARKKG